MSEKAENFEENVEYTAHYIYNVWLSFQDPLPNGKRRPTWFELKADNNELALAWKERARGFLKDIISY